MIINKFLNNLALKAINFYQKYISIFKKPCCRFYPTCSSYAKDAFLNFNFLKAVFYSIRRIIKCHPFHSGGYDPLVKK